MQIWCPYTVFHTPVFYKTKASNICSSVCCHRMLMASNCLWYDNVLQSVFIIVWLLCITLYLSNGWLPIICFCFHTIYMNFAPGGVLNRVGHEFFSKKNKLKSYSTCTVLSRQQWKNYSWLESSHPFMPQDKNVSPVSSTSQFLFIYPSIISFLFLPLPNF